MIAGSSAGEISDRLWAEAANYFRGGRVEVDLYLGNRVSDRRLGLSVIGRPSPAVRKRSGSFLNQVKAIALEQHAYLGSELHLALLSLSGATEASVIVSRQGQTAGTLTPG